MTSRKLQQIIDAEDRDARGGIEGRSFKELVGYTRSLETELNEIRLAQIALTNMAGLVRSGQSEGAIRISTEYWAGWRARHK